MGLRTILSILSVLEIVFFSSKVTAFSKMLPMNL